MKTHWLVLAIAALMLVSFEAPATAQQETSADDVTVQRVWSGTEVAFGMTRPSPDGRYLTQGWFEWDLGIIDLVTRERRTLGLRAGDLTEDPSWSHRAFYSPDGEEIAYVWRTWRSDEASDVGLSLRLVPSGGGEPQIIVPSGEYSWMQLRGWFPDGKHLLVVLWDDENGCFCRLRVSDGAIEPIIEEGDVPPGAAAGPLYGFSPDGQHLAYDRGMPDGDRDLYLLNVNTAEIRPLLEGRASDRLMGWLPDGSGLLFLSDRGATSGIWTLPLGSGLEPGEPRLLRADIWNAVPLGMSRDAAFYGVEVEQPHVYTGAIDTENGGYLAPPGPVQEANDGRSYNGEFSPDGLYLAYAVYRGGDDRDYYELVVRAVGGDDVRVFEHDLQIGPIGWTPDSRGVLVYSEPRGDKARVERLDLETGEFTVANPSPEANQAGMHFQVSPDGRHMYSIAPAEGWGEDLRNHLEDLSKLGLYEVGVYDDSKRLIAPVEFPGAPRLSPDGKTLAVLEADRENLDYARIYTIPLAGGEPTTVFEIAGDITVRGRAIGWGSGAQWTADGTHLLFTLDGAVMKVSAEGGPIEKLVDLPEGRQTHLRFHPDGSRFVIDAGLNKGEIWIVKGLPGTPAGAATTDR